MDGYLPSAYVYGLEVAIKNPKKKYQDKVSALLSGWERLASLSNAPPGSVNNLAECLYRDTLTLVLKGHWPKLSPATKTHLSVTLQRCVSSLLNQSALKKCRDLIGLVKNPWGHPTLTGILNDQEGIHDSEVLEFCLSEKECMLFMRLETLCDSKCEDLALKLARACVRCLRFSDTRFHDECSVDERYYILDLYIFLLYKFKNIQEIINELKHLDLKEGLELIRRYSAAKNDNSLPRVWKNSHKVAELAAQYFLAVAMVKPVAETVDLLKDLMAEWVILHCREEVISENLANMIRKLIQPAESALHVYIFIEVLVDKFGYSLKSLCIELYIRGLAMDMNELEHQKVVGDEEKVKETEVRLSYGFQKLADLLKDNIGVSRECLLTAFSLYPTDKTFKQLREMALASGKISSTSQVIVRKRKTKIPLRSREERSCKSIYRRKKVVESDVSGPSTSNKGPTEVFSGSVSKEKSMVTVAQRRASSVISFNGNGSGVMREKNDSESQFSSQSGITGGINVSKKCNGDDVVELRKLASPTDNSSSTNVACANRHGRGNNNLNVDRRSSLQTDISLSVDVLSVHLRSRSGVLNLAADNTAMNVASPVDVHSHKRNRSGCVDNGSLLREVSEKMVYSKKTLKRRFRSGDNNVCPFNSCFLSSHMVRNSTKTLSGGKCYCECCDGRKYSSQSGFRRRSYSEGSLYESSGVTEIYLNKNVNCNEFCHNVRNSGLERLKMFERKSPDNWPSESLLSPPYSVHSSKSSIFDNFEGTRNGNYNSRLRSRCGISASVESFFKEGKPRLVRSYSQPKDVSVMADSVELDKFKSSVSLDIDHRVGAELRNCKHQDKCKAVHVSDGHNVLHSAMNGKPCTDQENYYVSNANDLKCKVCNHPHKDVDKKANDSRSSLISSTEIIASENAIELPCQLTGSNCASLKYDVISAPNEVLDAEKLGLTSQLCDDLAVVLSSPRWHMLSWVLEWEELSSICEKYLRNWEGSRNITKELKYLNIDYNQFKDRPYAVGTRDEYYGIEKGYEQWADVGSEHSGSEFSYSSSHKKVKAVEYHDDTDSDSSGISHGHKISLNSPSSSQSDTDLKDKAASKNSFISLSVSDSDTGTQDSRTESLGSDGCYQEKHRRKVPGCRRKKMPLVKRIAEKRLNDLSKIRIIVNDDLCKSNQDPIEMTGNAKEVMTIFSDLDENEKNTSAKQCAHSSCYSTVSILNTPERRDKDSKTLKSLRMFRPNHLKSIQDRICFSSAKESSKLKAKSSDEGIKFAPMLSTLNLNPRILLTRADVSSHYLKSKNLTPVIVKNTNLNTTPPTKIKGLSRNSQCLGEKKCYFSSNRKNSFSKTHKKVLKKIDGMRPGFKLIRQAVIESHLLARTVPGLDSLDMMVPPPSEPTVQVIQLPHNQPSTGGTHSSTAVNIPPKVTSQGVQTSPTTPPQKVTSTQGVQTSPVNTPLQKVTVAQGMHIAPPISRTTIVAEPGPSAVPHHPDDHWQQSVLNASASENVVTPNVPSFSSPSSRVEPAFSGVVMETCYLSQGNVISGTPVTAHIQRVGQPSVGLDGDSILAAQSLRRVHQCPQLLSGTHIPIVKGVNLDIVANLRAEALRNADLADSLSSSVGVQRGVQVTGSLDTQKVHIMSKKDVKTCMAPISSTRITENRIKNTGVKKVDEDSQTDNISPNKTECKEEDESGSMVVMEDGVSKLVGQGKKSQCLKVINPPASQVAMLPKFQQAFGKTIYSSSTPGSIDSSSRTRVPSIQDNNSCVPSATLVTSEKAEPVSTDGSLISKGVQTANLEESSPSKNTMNVLPTSASTSDGSKAVSPLLRKTAGSSLPAISLTVSHQVPVLCTVSSVASVSKQSDSATVDASNISTTTFSNILTTSRSTVTCQSSESSAHVSQKIPLVTSPLPVSSVCDAHLTTRPQITVPMKLSMVSLSTNLSEKELLLRSKMTELLNRALQRNSGAVANCSPVSLSSSVSGTLRDKRREGYVSSSSDEVGSDSMESSNDQEEPRISSSENIRCIIQSPRVSRPMVEISVEESTVSSGGSLQNALRSQHSVAGHAPSVLCSGSSDTPVATSHVSQSTDGTSSLIPHNSIHPAVSSTTLEQLREFESVLEQVTNTSQMKERKSVLPQSERETANDLTQQLLLTQASTPTNSADFENSNTPSTSFSRESFPSSSSSLTTSPKGGSTFTIQTTSLQANITSSRISSSTPVVVVTTYSQPIASPALSVTSQSSSSPSVTPASTPGKTPPKSSPKSSKTKSMKAAPTTTSKTAPVTKPQQKPQEDEETAQRIYAILDQYAEQLKNSPDLINKPAPRRRSNPPINPIGSSKRKKSTPTKLRLSGHPPVLTESSPGGDDPRTVGSEDSSSGITSLPQLHDSPGIITSNSEETPCHEGSPTLQIRRGHGAESSESRDSGLISRTTETSGMLSTSAPPGDVITQEASVMGMGTTGNNTPSSSSTVVTGKSLVVGSATALPLYVPGGVRQVLFPVASGLTASVQGRPVVVTKGSKVIRVHQVTVAGGSPMLAGAVAGAKPLQVTTGATTVQGALVVRQMCVNKAVVSTPSVSAPQMSPLTMVSATSAVKQLKLPVIQAVASGISSQAITGVTGQSPVVLPSGSHAISATSFLPPNIGGVRTLPLLETNKESVGTSTVEDNLPYSGELKVNQKKELLSSMAESNNEKQILPPSKVDSASEFLCVIKQDCPSPVDLSGLKKSCLGCETVPPLVASQPSISNLTSFSSASCVNAAKIEIDPLIKTQTNTFDEKINCDPSYKPPSDKIASETASIKSPVSVMSSCFQGTVLVDPASGQVSQRAVNDETRSVMECVDSMTLGKSADCGVSNTRVEAKADTCPKSDSNQNVMLQSSGMPSENSDVAERSQDVCSNIATNVIDGSRDVSKSVLTTLSGRPCVMFQDIQEPLTIQQASAISVGFSKEKKKHDLSLEGQLVDRVLSREKGDVMVVKEDIKALLDQPKQGGTLGSSIDEGKNSIVGIGASTRNPKTIPRDSRVSNAIFPGTKSCDERSSEDEMEKKINRNFTSVNSSEYCFPVKRDSKAGESPWRYVPVVKRISVSQGKAVPVDSSLIQSQIESEACLTLPHIADSLPDELKEGESDDGCRANFSPSIEISHSGVKRRLFSDEVLDYTTYPSAKKNDKIKTRIEKLSRVPDAIEREFRQTRLEIEKELRLQKSLSEECEDLGVDEPSTSDLFPEADLLLDPNPSPAYDQTMPDTSCAHNADSSEPFSSSDFRSIDSSSSVEGVHENASCSKMPNSPEANSAEDIKTSHVFVTSRRRKNMPRIKGKLSQGTYSSSDFRSIDSSSSVEGVNENTSCSKMPNSPEANSTEDLKTSPVYVTSRRRKNMPRIKEKLSQGTYSSSDFRSIDSSSSAEGVHESASCSKMPNSPEANSTEDLKTSPVYITSRRRKNMPRIKEKLSQGTYSSSDFRSIDSSSSAEGVHESASCSKTPNSPEVNSVEDTETSPIIRRKNMPRVRERASQGTFSSSDFRSIDSSSSAEGVHENAPCSKLPNLPEINSTEDIETSPVFVTSRQRKNMPRIKEKISQGTFSSSDFRSIDSSSSAEGVHESAPCSKLQNSPEVISVDDIETSPVVKRSRKNIPRIRERISQGMFSGSDFRSIESSSKSVGVNERASISNMPNSPEVISVEDIETIPVTNVQSGKNIPRIREKIYQGTFVRSNFRSNDLTSSAVSVHESTPCSKLPNSPDVISVDDLETSPVIRRKNIPGVREKISQEIFSSSDFRSIDLPSSAVSVQENTSSSKMPNLPEVESAEDIDTSPVFVTSIPRKSTPRIQEKISQGTFSSSDFRSIDLPSSAVSVQENTSSSKMPNLPEVESAEDIDTSPVFVTSIRRKSTPRIQEKISQGTFSSSDFRAIDLPSSAVRVQENTSRSNMPNSPEVQSGEDIVTSPILRRENRQGVRKKISQGTFSSSNLRSTDMPSSAASDQKNASSSKRPNLPEVESGEDIDTSPVFLASIRRKSTPRIQEKISQGTFSSSDFRSIDLPSSAVSVQENASSSKTPNLPEVESAEDIDTSPVFVASIQRKSMSRVQEKISQGTFSSSDFRSIDLPSSAVSVQENTSHSNMPISPEVESGEDIVTSPIIRRENRPEARKKISQGTFSSSNLRSTDLPSSAASVQENISSSKMPNLPEVESAEDIDTSPVFITSIRRKSTPRIQEKISQGTFSSSNLRSIDLPSSAVSVQENTSSSKMPNLPEVESAEDIDTSPVFVASIRRKSTPRIQEKISQGTFSSSDFRSIDLPSSAVSVQENTSRSNMPNSPEVDSAEDIVTSPIIRRENRLGVRKKISQGTFSSSNLRSTDLPSSAASVQRNASSSKMPNLPEVESAEDIDTSPVFVASIQRKSTPRIQEKISQGTFSSSDFRSIDIPSSAVSVQENTSSSNMPNSPEVDSGEDIVASPIIKRTFRPRIRKKISQGTFSGSNLRSTDLPSSAASVQENSSSSKKPNLPEVESAEDIGTSPVFVTSIQRKSMSRVQEKISQGTFSSSDFRSIDLPSSAVSVQENTSSSNMPNSPEVDSGEDIVTSPIIKRTFRPRIRKKISQGTFSGSNLKSTDLPSSAASVQENTSSSKMPNLPEVESAEDIDTSPVFVASIQRKNMSRVQEKISQGTISSSDFRSIDLPSSAVSVQENTSSSKMPNLPEVESAEDIDTSPVFVASIQRKSMSRVQEKISQGSFSSSDFRSIDLPSSAVSVQENTSCSNMPNSQEVASGEDIVTSPIIIRRTFVRRIRKKISQGTFTSSDFRAIDMPSSAVSVQENTSSSKKPNSPEVESGKDIETSPVFVKSIRRKSMPIIKEKISQGAFSSCDFRSIDLPSSAVSVQENTSCSNMPNSQEVASGEDIVTSPIIRRTFRPRIRKKNSQGTFSGSDFRSIDLPSSAVSVQENASCSKMPNLPEVESADDIDTSPVFVASIQRKSMSRVQEKISQGTFSSSDFRSIDLPSSAVSVQENTSCSNMPNSPEVESGEDIVTSPIIRRENRPGVRKKISQGTFSSSNLRCIDLPSSAASVQANASSSKMPNLPEVESGEDIDTSPVFVASIRRRSVPRVQEKIFQGTFSSSDFRSIDLPSSAVSVQENTSSSNMPNSLEVESGEDIVTSPIIRRENRPGVRKKISQGTFSSSNLRSIDLPSSAASVQENASSSKMPNLPEVESGGDIDTSPVFVASIRRKSTPRIQEKISQGTFSSSDFRSIDLPSSAVSVQEKTSCSNMPNSPEVDSGEDIVTSPIIRRENRTGVRKKISQGTFSSSDFRSIDLPSSAVSVQENTSSSNMPNSPEVESGEDIVSSPIIRRENRLGVRKKISQGTFSSSDFKSIDLPSSAVSVQENTSSSKMPNFPEVESAEDIDTSPVFVASIRRKSTPRIQEKISQGTFSSSDFRSIDLPSSAVSVQENTSCSNMPNSTEVISVEDVETSPIIRRSRKYVPCVREGRKRWKWVRNYHGSLDYRKRTVEDEKMKPITQQAPKVCSSVVGAGSLNGSNTFSQSHANIISFSSSSGEDSVSHPVEGTTHTTTFSSDITYSSPQEDTITSPISPHSHGLDVSTTPTAAQKFNITYGKRCHTYGKEYCSRGSKRSRVCRFIDYACDQGDSQDTCDSWDSINSIEKESTSGSSKCGRMYHGTIKDMESPSTSLGEDDDGKSNPDFQEATANHSFSNLIPITNTLKISQENADEPILEGLDDNAVLPPSNGIESDDENNAIRKNSLAKSLRKRVIEKNAKKHMLDKIDLYPRVCLKKWKGKDSITCSRYSLELDNVSAVPTGSKHLTCVERPLLESESSVSSEPSSENSSKTSVEQDTVVGHLGLSKSLILGKDEELNLPPECPNASGLVKSSLRRSSLRGHVKKGCPCCNGSPEPKKSRLLKGENYIKKGHSGKSCSKLHIAKKR